VKTWMLVVILVAALGAAVGGWWAILSALAR
jgi:hypothetical protein